MAQAPVIPRGAATRYVPQVPEGWEKCPRWGDPRFFEGLNIIPCKVPLDDKFNKFIRPSAKWTLSMAIRELRSKGLEVATVIDLTKSRHYYDYHREMEALMQAGIPGDALPQYYKIECRGRGESPQPSEVSEAVWRIFMHHVWYPDKYVLLHCTHGFNRTGFVLVAALVRLRREKGMTVKRALTRFAASRPPGVYKDHYINDLFKYYHEARDPRVITPPVPVWKASGDADDAADAANEEANNEDGQAGEQGAGAAAKPPLSHDDIWSIGERVCPEEAEMVKTQVCSLLQLGGPPRGPQRFPGMQPVSLLAKDLFNLQTNRYWATWKADGTRYMALILKQGTYLMDRSFNVVRCEMRFPNGVKRPPPGQKNPYPVGGPHDMTLLDGEMVLDHDPEGNQPPRLRYLIYDCCMINSIPIIDKKWSERYRAIETDLVVPRNLERKYIEGWRNRRFDEKRAEYIAPPYMYDYSAETFSVRQKPFWPVWQIDKVFARFHNPSVVGHESDGLILQGYEHKYNAGTCDLLYKWKFAHMNSVDFLLKCATVPGPDGQPVLDTSAKGGGLTLLLLDQAASRGARIAYVPVERIDKEGHWRVEFPPDVDPLTYDGKLAECTFDRARGVWLFMRERRDKDTPNGSRVYLKIKDSILNHVEQELLVGTLKEALLQRPPYEHDRAAVPPDVRHALERDVYEWQARQEEMHMQQQQQHNHHNHHEYGEDGNGLQPPSPPAVGEDPDGDHTHYGGGGGGGGGGYNPSEAAGAGPGVEGDGGGMKRAWEDTGQGGGEGEEQEAKRRLIIWGDLEDHLPEDCPGYVGFGFGPV